MKVFISYSSKDHDFALRLADKLTKDLIEVWMDDWEMKAGDSIVQKINQGLEHSNFLIIVLSEHSIKSEWVLRELNSTIMRQLTKKDIKILPILLEVEPEELPPLLSDIYGIKFQRDVWNETQYRKLIVPIKEKIESEEMGRYQDIYFENIVHVDLILAKEQPTKHEVEFILKLIRDEHYRNYFFKKVTSLHWFAVLKREGFFKPSEETKPQQDKEKGLFFIPVWNALPYLEVVSQKANLPGNEKYINELLAIITDVSSYKDANGKRIDNYRAWWYFVKILVNIPKGRIPMEIINLVPAWLDSRFDTSLVGSEIATKLLPKFLDDSPTEDDVLKGETLIKSITEVRAFRLPKKKAGILKQKEEKRLVVDPFWLSEAFNKYSEIIGVRCSKGVIEDFANKIKGLLKRREDGTYKSFYEESKLPLDEPLEMLTSMLKGVLLGKAKSNVDTTNQILRDFLKDKYLYFPKMAIYIIGRDIDHYGPLFWEVLKGPTGVRILGNALYLGDELKYLLKNLKQLSDKQKHLLEKTIEQAVNRHPPKEDAERYSALFKQEFYEALSEDPRFKHLYEEMKQITKVETELHPAIGRIESRVGPGPAPVTKEEILRMGNLEIAEFLSKFKTKDPWEGPTVGGLSNVLKEAVKADPNKFADNLEPFESAGFIYIYKILDGFRETYKEKHNFNWGKVFGFIDLYIKKEQFWKDAYIVEKGEWLGGAVHEWVVGIIPELIEDGTKDDSWAFPEEHLETAKEIIFYLLSMEPKKEEEITDYVTHALNTPCGKLISSLVNLAFRIARVNDKKGVKNEPRWSEEYRNAFNEILGKKIIEAYTSLGRFLPYFYYLDKNWVTAKMEDVSTQKGSKYWQAFMDGYLSIGTVYDYLYELMREHYQYGLSYRFKDKRDREQFIQHICIGYLRDREKLDDPSSLFKRIIDAWQPDEIKEIIGFFWTQRHYLEGGSDENERTKEKIIGFWRKIYERYKAKDEKCLSQEDMKILSSVSRLAVFLPGIVAESNEWLMLSAMYVHEDFNSTFFIEYLDKIKDKGDSKQAAEYIGAIYLGMLQKTTPDYDKKHIRSIIEFLYNSGAQAIADDISNTYGRRGYEFLRDIYEKYSALKLGKKGSEVY
jgi:hypothetical protein